MFPNFLIIGERRSGTSSLYFWLRTNPNVWMVPEKDTSFFFDDWLVSPDTPSQPQSATEWDPERKRRDYERRFAGSGCAAAVGEKSADILFWPEAHLRLRSVVPDARLLVILRNPIRRAWSHFWNETGKGRETSSFEDAIERDVSGKLSTPYENFHLSYVSRGHYARSLKILWRTFPREQTTVLVLEKLLSNPRAHMRTLCSALGVPLTWADDFSPTLHNENQTLVTRNWVRRMHLSRLEKGYVAITRRLAILGSRMSVDRVSASKRFRALLEKPFRRPAHRETMSRDANEMLSKHYNGAIAELEELLHTDLGEWRGASQ